MSMKSNDGFVDETKLPPVCVIFPGALGDFLCFLPALRKLANKQSVVLYARSEFAELRRTSAPASRSVSGSLGAGSGQVSVTTMSGRVMLLRRAERGPPDARADEQPDNKNEMEGEAS